jgi:hypothetical protein
MQYMSTEAYQQQEAMYIAQQQQQQMQQFTSQPQMVIDPTYAGAM